MTEVYQHNSQCICLSNWQGQAPYASLLILRNRSVNYSLDLSEIRSEAVFTDATSYERNILCKEDAFRRVRIQFIRTHALEHGS